MLLVFFLVIGPAVARSIQVPGDASTVQEAIRQARPGDTIYIHGGLYRERVIVDKSVNLVGVTTTANGTPPNPPAIQIEPGLRLLTNQAHPLISYAVIAPKTGSAIEIRADQVRITDLVLISSDSCVVIGNRSEISIEGSLMGACGTGIAANGGADLSIIGNRFELPVHTGVDLTYMSDVEIQGNLFTGGMTGIKGENVQRWSVRENTFRDLKVAFSGNGMSDSLLQDNTMENCTIGYTLLSSRNNVIQADRFQNITQYLYLLNSPSHQVTIGSGNNATTLSRDLSSGVTYRTSWFTLTGENFAFSLTPSGSYSGYRNFGERVQIASEVNRTRDTDMVKIEAEADVEMWDDIDPFSFGIYRVDRGAPLFTGLTYVSGDTIRTSTSLNASGDGSYALLARKKTPFGLTIEGITFAFLVVAGLAALFLYRRRRGIRYGPSRSRAQEFRNRKMK
ncbi:MAG: right-handed parallel beta-helix repeat-containing protein [Methanomicrobiales archaeon]|nr:right-handed parallel beta-helix repeat-containing protein [Methanomicrobiales archaeon]